MTPDSYYPTPSRSGTAPTAPEGEIRQVPALPLLVDAFVQGALVDENQDLEKRKRKGQLHFLASVFANLTTVSLSFECPFPLEISIAWHQSPPGRLFFLTPRPANPLGLDEPLEYPLAKITVFTEHKDTMRRGGVVSTIKWAHSSPL